MSGGPVKKRAIPKFAWPKVHWLAVNTRLSGTQIANHIGISEAYVSIILKEYRNAGVVTPGLRDDSRGTMRIEDMPRPEDLPLSGETRPVTGNPYKKAEKTRFTAEGSSKSSSFDPKSHYESRHYKGNFDL